MKSKGEVMYYRLCEGKKSKGILIPDTEDLDKYIKDRSKDYYVSIYKYNENQKKVFDQIGTVRGISDVVTNKLTFDFDDAENPNKAKQDTETTVSKLIQNGISKKDIKIYFSGKKGFHVIVETKHNFSPAEVKNIAKGIAGKLETFDTTIYNANRVFRVPNTKHSDTDYYKIPITVDALFKHNLDEIKNGAQKHYQDIQTNEVELPSTLLQFKVEKEKPRTSVSVNDLDLSKKPAELSPWKYAIEQGFFPPGSRNNALIVLAATYRGLGYSKTKCYYALKAAAELQSERFSSDRFSKEEIWENIISQVYSPHWKGGTFGEENIDDKLKDYFINELGLQRGQNVKRDLFHQPDDLFNSFADFAKNIDQNTITTGIKPLDESVHLTTSMLIGLLGSPSSGKTTVAMEIMKNTALKGEKVAFFSMDMSKELVFQRLAQKVTGENSEKIFSYFKDDSKKDKRKEIAQLINDSYPNTKMCFKTALTVADIKSALIQEQETTGQRTRLVVVDYLECISSSISEPTARISMIAQELKDIANELQTAVLLLLQPPKRAGDPSYPLLSYNDIKGAATIAQACSVVISLWREGFNPKDVKNDKYVSFAVLKNRMGQLAQVDCSFDGLTGKIGELDAIQKVNLQTLREAKNEEDESDEQYASRTSSFPSRSF